MMGNCDCLQAIIAAVNDAIILIDENGIICDCNPATEQIFGYGRDQLKGRSICSLMPHSEMNRHQENFGKYHGGGTHKVFHHGKVTCALRVDGTSFPMELTVSEVFLDGKRYFSGIIRDVSERERAIQKLKDREQEMRAIFQFAPCGIVTIDTKGKIRTFNPTAEEIFGYRSEEIVGQNISLFMPKHQRIQHDAHIEAYCAGIPSGKAVGKSREMFACKKGGELINIELRVEEMRFGDELFFVGTITDISERKKTEQLLNEKRKLLQLVMDLAPVLIFVKDREGRYFLANKAMGDMYGVHPKDLIGKLQREFHPNPNELQGFLEAVGKALDSGERQLVPEELFTDVHGVSHVLYTIKTPVRIGDQMAVLGVAMNITESLAVKNRVAEAEIAWRAATHASAAKSRFLATVSHDLRTPLAAILAFSELAMEALYEGDGETLAGYIKHIIENAEAQTALINDVLDLGKIESGGALPYSPELQPFTPLVKSVVEGLRPLAEKKGLSINLVDQLGEICAEIDTQRLRRVVQNLLANAIKFANVGTEISIHLKVDDEVISCSVADFGASIPEGELESIFDPFTQSSATDLGAGGTGMGLAIAKKIVESHGGKIWANYAPEIGAVFTFTIPV